MLCPSHIDVSKTTQWCGSNKNKGIQNERRCYLLTKFDIRGEQIRSCRFEVEVLDHSMGATNSTAKRYNQEFQSNIYSTPPKLNNPSLHQRLVQLQCDPRSPTGNFRNSQTMPCIRSSVQTGSLERPFRSTANYPQQQ